MQGQAIIRGERKYFIIIIRLLRFFSKISKVFLLVNAEAGFFSSALLNRLKMMLFVEMIKSEDELDEVS